MPKSASTNLKLHMASGALTIATCVRIIRKDGVMFGFTTHDEPFDYDLASLDTVGSLTYTPFSSIEPVNYRSSSGTDVDNSQFTGAKDDAYVNTTDLKAGRYDDTTEVTVFKVNYNSLADGHVITYRGYIGEITLDDFTYKVETLALLGRAKKDIGSETQPTCGVKRFCDSQCKLNEADFTNFGVQSNSNEVGYALNLEMVSDTNPSGYYTYGIIRCVSGDNVGFEREIKSHTNSGSIAQIILKETFPLPITTSDTFDLIRGCDRSFGVCAGDFSNAVNFRGEPHLPGNATLLKVGIIPKK